MRDRHGLDGAFAVGLQGSYQQARPLASGSRAPWRAWRVGGVARADLGAGWMEGISRAAQGGETGGPMSKARRIDRNIAGGGGGRGGEERTSVRRCLAAGRNGCSGPVALSRGADPFLFVLYEYKVGGQRFASRNQHSQRRMAVVRTHACTQHAARSTRTVGSRLRLKPLQRRIPRSEMP